MSIKQLNAKNAFNKLIVELTKHKRKWTPRQRYLFNYVAKFLEK